MTTSTTDPIITACQQGDRTALGAIYDEHHRRVYRLAVRIVGRDDADDLLQQIFLQVLSKVAQFNGQSQFGTWLFRLATNECLQHLRKRRRTTEVQFESDLPARSCGSSNDLDDRELLETALNRLDPDLRTIFVLREIEEMDYRQLADTLQISEGTVASRLNRARKHLKQFLVNLGWEP